MTSATATAKASMPITPSISLQPLVAVAAARRMRPSSRSAMERTHKQPVLEASHPARAAKRGGL